ncbi:MAG: isochorismatase family protein [Propionibacteriales bacterium]|nr:isochorismatase family protein [Propionibacteriales bacterium]
MSRALIVVDVQESFRQRPSWSAVSAPDIVDRVASLVDHARRRADLVIWVMHSEPGTGTEFDTARGFVRLMEGLEPAAGEPVVKKTSINAFTTTNLQQLLTQRHISELTICGIQTEQCCETTTRVAADLGYDVTFVIDATATFPIAHRDAPSDRPYEAVLADPTTLSTAEIIERTEYALAGRFATIRTIEEVVGTSRAVA